MKSIENCIMQAEEVYQPYPKCLYPNKGHFNVTEGRYAVSIG